MTKQSKRALSEIELLKKENEKLKWLLNGDRERLSYAKDALLNIKVCRTRSDAEFCAWEGLLNMDAVCDQPEDALEKNRLYL